jgi:hypothetical protein
MKHLGFRLPGKPSQAQISTVRIYDRIDARRDLSIGEVHLGTAVVGPRWAFELVRFVTAATNSVCKSPQHL